MSRSPGTRPLLLATLGLLLLCGCTGQERLDVWPFWLQGDTPQVDASDGPSSWVDADDATTTAGEAAASDIRQATAEEPLDPPPAATGTNRADEVLYADPLLRPGHMLR